MTAVEPVAAARRPGAGSARRRARRAAVLLLPGPQRGGEPRAARRRGARRACRRSPGRSRSSSSTTARATRRRPSPTGSPPSIRASSVPSTTRRTSATGRRSGPASGRPATTSWRSPTGTASSRWPTSAGSRRGWPRATSPTSSSGYRIKRADPLVRTLYARAYRLANRIFFGLRVRDVDCACKLVPAPGARRAAGRVGRGVLLGRAADQAPGERPHRRRGGRAALPADRRLGDRAPGRRSSSGPCATSGSSACACGRTATGALRRGAPMVDEARG